MSENAADDKVHDIRTAWILKDRVSTLPRWGQVQKNAITLFEGALPDIDVETKSMIVRDLLFRLRCHTCERKLSEKCNFSICVRGLMSGAMGR